MSLTGESGLRGLLICYYEGMNEMPERDIFAELARVRTMPTALAVESDEEGGSPDKKVSQAQALREPTEADGQLTVDVFQDDDNLYVQSAVAGVGPEDLDITITKDSVTIKGKRARTHTVKERDFFYQECFWGAFSRSIILPEEVDPDRSHATLKNGILTVKLPRADGKKRKGIKIKSE